MILLLISILAFSNQQNLKFSGIATDSKGNVAYLEEHDVIYENGAVKSSTTSYMDENKKPIATLISLYSPHKWMPTYSFKDLRHETYNGVNATTNEIEMFTQEDKKLKTKKAALQPNMIGGQGFHYFIQDNLESLAKGEKVKTKFVLPGALDYYSFVIQKSDKKKVKESEIYLGMKLDSLLSIFISPIHMTYDLPTKRLMGYEGESNLQDKNQKSIIVDIAYKYE